jgi:hypothetical protein
VDARLLQLRHIPGSALVHRHHQHVRIRMMFILCNVSFLFRIIASEIFFFF